MPKLRHVKKSTPLSPYAVYKYGNTLIIKQKGKKAVRIQLDKKKK